jgi:CheY-like chemotaxis protein
MSSARLTVLVVDDHAAAREVISRLENDDRIGAVVTDVSMPDMTGVELAFYVREHYPALPIAIVSGDIGELERSIIARSGVPFLKKPVRAEALYAAIREAIGTAD